MGHTRSFRAGGYAARALLIAALPAAAVGCCGRSTSSEPYGTQPPSGGTIIGHQVQRDGDVFLNFRAPTADGVLNGNVWRLRGDWKQVDHAPGGAFHTAEDLVVDAEGRLFTLGYITELQNGHFRGAKDSIRRSVDGGDSWHQVLETGVGITRIAAGGGAIYASANTILRSTDGGDSWQEVASLGFVIGLVATDDGSGYAIVAEPGPGVGGPTGLLRGTGAGTWTEVNPDPSIALGTDGTALFRNGASNASTWTIEKSSDRGATWTTSTTPQLDARCGPPNPTSIAAKPNGAVVVAGFSEDSEACGAIQFVEVSTDGGATWTASSAPPASGLPAPLSVWADGTISAGYEGDLEVFGCL